MLEVLCVLHKLLTATASKGTIFKMTENVHRSMPWTNKLLAVAVHSLTLTQYEMLFIMRRISSDGRQRDGLMIALLPSGQLSNIRAFQSTALDFTALFVIREREKALGSRTKKNEKCKTAWKLLE